MKRPGTRQKILETLNQRGPLCVDEIARAAGLSEMATRYHLGLLLQEGQLVLRDSRHLGCVGRPQVVYALSENAYERLPKQYESLAEQLLREVAETLGAKDTRALLRRAGRRAAGAAPAMRAGARIQHKLSRAAKFLSTRGYAANCEKAVGDLSLAICNCPFRHLARSRREVCEMDLALVGALLEAPVKMTHCIAHQDAQCRFVIAR